MAEEVESLDVKMANLNRVVEDYKKKYLLNQFLMDGVDISITIPELKKMDPVEAMEKVMQWRTYAAAINVRRQELLAKLGWVKANWDMYMGVNQQYISREYGYTAHDRYMIILEKDNYAKRLYKLKTDIELEMTLLDNTTMNTNYLAEAGQKIAEHSMWREKNVNYRN